ncbi:helix-turn-helix transcriptional regulator [Streptomyces sp. A7024]|uniref:Helix-turn-helix transcriptional regulator n=1 Tax=Streptomyces coryli TaxID=1128680 RepID=A0A6G4U785_9ACTN|nr:helix-turn-helix domain-containing protein [Streptomyces coryli]NGN67157.1 helix-turn-helix transcriptional regulator [Streptomyces coryli]
MALGKDYVTQECGIARALEIVGERWTLLVLRDAFYGVRRYNDFLTHLGIPRAVLATRLQALTDAGVMEKRAGEHGRHEYVLTEAAYGLWPALHALRVWGRDLTGSDPVYVFTHAACGTELGAYGECPECAVPVPPVEVAMRRGSGVPKDPEHPVNRALEQPRRLLDPLVV